MTVTAAMSLGSKFLVSGIFLLQTMWWVNGAAIQSSSPVPFTSRPPNMQMPMQRNNSDNPRNATSLSPEDFKFFMPTEQTRREVPNPSAPTLPFGINPNMPQPPPQGFMMSPPPGFRPTQTAQQFMTPLPGVMMQPPPNMMNRPIQQGQSQPPRQEVPQMVNATTVHVPLVNSNASRPNNNTRRETEQTSTTTTKPGTVTTRKPFQETPLGNDKQESDGSKMKQPQAPPNQFVGPHPMMMPFNPMMMNQPLFIDPMGRLMMLVPVPLDPSRSPLFAQANPQQVPQGPPVPVSFQVPLGQLPVGTVPIMPDFSKQPPSPPRGDKNKSTTTAS